MATKTINNNSGVAGTSFDADTNTGTAGDGTQRVTLATDIALPAGTNAIGKLAANSGVDIGDVDVLTIGGQTPTYGAGAVAAGTPRVTHASDDPVTTAVQLLDDTIFTDDAAFTPGTSKVSVIGCQADESSTDSVDEGDAGAPRMTLDRKIIVQPQPHTAGGLSIFRSLDLDETEEDVKTAAGQVYGWYIANLATTTRFVKFYNATAANVSVGSTTPVLTLPIPGNSSDDVAANALGGMGIAFDTAICVAATTGVADANTGAPAANDVVINVFYK